MRAERPGLVVEKPPLDRQTPAEPTQATLVGTGSRADDPVARHEQRRAVVRARVRGGSHRLGATDLGCELGVRHRRSRGNRAQHAPSLLDERTGVLLDLDVVDREEVAVEVPSDRSRHRTEVAPGQ